MVNEPRAVVAVVEDHQLLADSIALALSVVGITVHWVDERERAALDRLVDLRPDLVLLDLAVGDDTEAGMRLLRPLCEAGIPVLIVTGVTDTVRHAQCVEAGALAVFSKVAPMARLVDAVQRALKGQPLLAESERLSLLFELEAARRAERRWRAGVAGLTPREREVLAALIAGHPAGAIAHATGLSLATVRSHIRSILLKLDVHSQLEAVSLAVRVGWRPGEDGG